MTPQQETDELLRERQERRRREIAPERRLDATASVKQPSAARRGLKQNKSLPRYVFEGSAAIYSFQASPVGLRVPLRGEPGTSEFRAAYSAALVDAAAAEPDHDDWTELERLHDQQRKELAK
jgi:hypothetical protein